MGATDDEASIDELPAHRVKITKPFYAGKYEVTIGQTLNWLNSPGVNIDDTWFSDGSDELSPVRRSGTRWVRNSSSVFGVSDDKPMRCISWHGAVAFCNWCSRQDATFRYRLPTEAEWEYMARAGSTSEYPWGNTENGTNANVSGNQPFGLATGVGPHKMMMVTVGSYQANAWGLFDTAGNMEEWCSDWYAANYYGISPASDPRGPGSGTSRVVRGGSWFGSAASARSASRNERTPGSRNAAIGFRVVAE